ncbi:MAG: macro domain-containing protein [Pleurocapsa sp. SU_196_0]|nr:macro domain-containing protein [Pleurocapsa sp. SU_196_0]
MIEFVRGDLLQAPTEALVNTVNTVGVMGKGIALQFKRQFPKNFKAYEQACKHRNVRVGKMFVVDNGLLSQPRWIINFPTKEHWRSPTRVEFITSGLEDLKHVIQTLGIRSIAIPALGCSNGGLEWSVVKPLIEQALGSLEGVFIQVFEPLPPEVDLPPLRPLNRTLNFTLFRAALVKVFALYAVFGDDLGRLEAQKLAYFLTQAGLDTKLVFTKNQFGPFAERLNHSLIDMEGQFIEGYGDRQRTSHIRVLPGVLDDAQAVLETDSSALEAVRRTLEVAAGFETPIGMELLASTHWLVHHEAAQNPAQVYDHLQTWNEHKTRFTLSDIQQAWEQLDGLGWFNPATSRQMPVSKA